MLHFVTQQQLLIFSFFSFVHDFSISSYKLFWGLLGVYLCGLAYREYRPCLLHIGNESSEVSQLNSYFFLRDAI